MLAIRIALPHRHSGNSVDPGKNKRAKVDMTILAEKAAYCSIAAMHKPRFLYNLNWASGFQATRRPGTYLELRSRVAGSAQLLIAVWPKEHPIFIRQARAIIRQAIQAKSEEAEYGSSLRGVARAFSGNPSERKPRRKPVNFSPPHRWRLGLNRAKFSFAGGRKSPRASGARRKKARLGKKLQDRLSAGYCDCRA